MVKKTEVLVCDVCNNKVANTKCSICKKDLCNTCAKNVVSVFDKNDWTTEVIDLEICLECKKRTSSVLKKDMELSKKGFDKNSIIGIMNKTFIDLIKSKGILNEIEENAELV